MKQKFRGADLAAYLDLSARQIRTLADEGTLPRLPDGKFDPDRCRLAYIKYLRDEGRRVTPSDNRDRAQAARAEEIELRVARERGKLIEFGAVEEVAGDIVATLSSELAGVPASCTRDLELREVMEARLNETIDRCRRRFEETGKALQAGRDPLDDGEEADA